MEDPQTTLKRCYICNTYMPKPALIGAKHNDYYFWTCTACDKEFKITNQNRTLPTLIAARLVK